MEQLSENYKYQGAVHIHSSYSDGSGDIKSIAISAKKAGLSWIIITDHNNLDASEGIIEDVYVLKGEEISPKENNHYIVLGIDKLIPPSENCQDNINAVRLNNGFGFAAHPDESESRNNNFKPIKWTDKNNIPDGVEIWNWFSQFADNYNSKNIFSVIYAYLFKNNLVKKPYPETISWWDTLNNQTENIVPAIGGIDAHALKYSKYLIPVTIFPYKDMFGTIINEINLSEPLSKDFETAKKQIFNALKLGNNIIVNKSVYDVIPKIYTSYEDGDKYLNIECGKISDIKIFANGTEISSCKAKSFKLQLVQAGKYRVEVEINAKGFAYSNPIIIKEV